MTETDEITCGTGAGNTAPQALSPVLEGTSRTGCYFNELSCCSGQKTRPPTRLLLHCAVCQCLMCRDNRRCALHPNLCVSRGLSQGGPNECCFLELYSKLNDSRKDFFSTADLFRILMLGEAGFTRRVCARASFAAVCDNFILR